MKSGVYVRAKDSNGKWSSVLAEDLDDRSFKVFVLSALAACGIVVAVREQHEEKKELTTPVPHPEEET